MPLSLEVIADDAPEIERQAKILAGLGGNVYVKVPVVNTRGELNTPTIRRLHFAGVKVNVTAVFETIQIDEARRALDCSTLSIISVFSGRIADAGENPVPFIEYAVKTTRGTPIEVLWASVREPYNIVEAENAGADIITVFPTMLAKMGLFGKDLTEFSIETSQMFYRDSIEAMFTL